MSIRMLRLLKNMIMTMVPEFMLLMSWPNIFMNFWTGLGIRYFSAWKPIQYPILAHLPYFENVYTLHKDQIRFRHHRLELFLTHLPLSRKHGKLYIGAVLSGELLWLWTLSCAAKFVVAMFFSFLFQIATLPHKVAVVLEILFALPGELSNG